jgi:SRSO17 transposase
MYARMRWPIEQSHGDTEQVLGLDHFERGDRTGITA